MNTILLFLFAVALIVAAKRFNFVPFGMMAASDAPPATPKGKICHTVHTALTTTENPVFRFVAQQDMIPLALRCTPTTSFAFTTDTTYVISMEDDTTKISTDNAAVTVTQTAPIEATFAAGTRIAAGSVVEVVFTLGGTSPSVDASSLIEFDYLAG